MKKYGLIFPGQGSQVVGMGKSVYKKSASAREIFTRADEQLKFAITEQIFFGEAASLMKTKIAQPAIMVTSLALLAAFREECNLEISAFAGHSLGEFSAHVAANCFSYSDGLKIVAERGVFMEEAAVSGDGGMAAVLGIDFAKLDSVCKDVSSQGDLVSIANVNCPGQLVISGTKTGIIKAGNSAKEAGAKRIIPLKVSGAFHSELMKGASAKLHELLKLQSINKPVAPIYTNYTALPTTDYIDSLTKQMYSPVLWQQTIENMIASGINTFIEIGPGQVLTGLIKRINKEVAAFSIYDYESLTQFINILED